MTHFFLRFFYLCLLYTLYLDGYFVHKLIPSAGDFVLFAKPFSIFLESLGSFVGVYVLGLLLLLYCVIRPGSKVRFFATVVFLVLISAKNSFGKINHDAHIWMFASVVVCFIALNKPLLATRNIFLLRGIQSYILSIYFISGLWKLRDLDFSSLGQAMLDHIAYTIAEGYGPGEPVQEMLAQLPTWFFSVGLMGIILFQLSSVVPVILFKYFQVWGVFAFLFHLMTGIFLGIWFSSAVLATLFFLIIIEELFKAETEKAAIQS